MQLLLEELASAVGHDAHAILILDRVGWHNASRLVWLTNVTPLHLAPYSPELNAIVRVWLYLRERFLSHQVFEDAEAIIDACCEAWNALLADTGRLRSLATLPWGQGSILRGADITRALSSRFDERPARTPRAPGAPRPGWLHHTPQRLACRQDSKAPCLSYRITIRSSASCARSGDEPARSRRSLMADGRQPGRGHVEAHRRLALVGPTIVEHEPTQAAGTHRADRLATSVTAPIARKILNLLWAATVSMAAPASALTLCPPPPATTSASACADSERFCVP